MKSTSEQENAVCDLRPDARQPHQFVTRRHDGERVQPRQIDLAPCHHLSRAKKIRCAKAHPAVAQFAFAAERERGAIRKREGGGAARRRGHAFAEPLTEQRDDLLDLHDLLGRGEDERGETFPRVLPEQTQAAAVGDGGPHRLVVGKSFQHRAEVRPGLQIIFQPRPVGDRRGGHGENSTVARLEPHPVWPDDSLPAAVARLPAKRLTGRERGREVVVPDGQENLAREGGHD